MARITEEERKRFHGYLDEALDKCNRPKNTRKKHWFSQSLRELFRHFEDETIELSIELFKNFDYKAAEDECLDNINLPMMILDKLRNN